MKYNKSLTIVLVLIAGVGAFLITMAALADDNVQRTSPGQIADTQITGLSSRLSNRSFRVRCDRGDSLNHYLSRARPGTTLIISGVCKEIVVVNTDRITLRGRRGAVIDGSGFSSEAVVLIDGAQGVTLDSLTIRNGSDQGVLATHQARVLFKSLTARDNATVGLAVDRSHVEIEDVTLIDNAGSGMDAFSGSTVLARGTVQATSNGGDGLAINGKTFFELRGATVTASNNAGSGVSIINDSRLQIFSFPEAQGSSVTADANGFAGIGLLGSELGVVGSQFFGSGANVLTVSNNIIGFFMPAGAILSPHATARFVSQFNGVGMLMEDNANALIVGGLDVGQNGVGISAVGAGTLTLVSVPPNPSSVEDNQLDAELGFGTRATIDGVSIGSLVCDDTALVRGSTTCP